MRILHVLPTADPKYGGPIRVAEALCTELLRSGHEAWTRAPAGDMHPALGRLAYWPGVEALRQLEQEVRGVDLVHVHGLWTVPTSMAARFAARGRIPFVITPHGMLDRWSRKHHGLRKRVYATLLERRNLEAAAAIHFFNEEEREEARELGLRVPTFLLPNGVHPGDFAELPGRNALWRRFPSTAQRHVVLFLGRLHPKKGLPLLIDALVRLVAQGSDVLTVIAGPDEGRHRAEIESLVTRHRLHEHVLFTGPVFGEDKRVLLGGADSFVLPSYQEGDSVAVKEALAAGLPVVITRACHLPEVAAEGAGFIVNPVAEEIRLALTRLREDESLRMQMSRRARALVERHFRWDTIGGELARRYEEIRERHRSVPARRVG